MKFGDLQYFIEVAKREHLGKASRFLNISPSALSHAIGRLEETINQDLFKKKGKRIFLTAAGRMLLDRGTQLLKEVENLRVDLQKENETIKGYYRLAGSHLLASKLLTPCWGELLKKYSDLKGEVLSLRSSDICRSVKAGEVDYGICFSPQSDPDLEIKKIYSGILRIVVRKKHPLSSLKSSEWIKKISDFPAIMPKAFRGVEVCETHPVFQKFNIKPNINFVYDSYDVALSQLSNSDSWGFFPDWIIKQSSSSNMLSLPLPKSWDATYQISSVWLRNKLFSKVFSLLESRVSLKLSA